MSKKKKTICEEKHFNEVFKMHSKVLRNYIYYKVGDSHLADDILQEAFIKLWHNCSSIPFDNALFFLKRVSKNLLLNNFKHKKVVLNFKGNKSNEKYDIESPDFVLEEKEFGIKVKKVIESLPKKEREVFLLNRIDKLKYKEIAELMNISVKTVEKRMIKALIIIRKHIGNV